MNDIIIIFDCYLNKFYQKDDLDSNHIQALSGLGLNIANHQLCSQTYQLNYNKLQRKFHSKQLSVYLFCQKIIIINDNLSNLIYF